jgi:hypothetical protein
MITPHHRMIRRRRVCVPGGYCSPGASSGRSNLAADRALQVIAVPYSVLGLQRFWQAVTNVQQFSHVK